MKYVKEVVKAIIIGLFVIYIFNVLMQGTELNIGLNFFNALVIGLFRIFGFIFILFFVIL